MNADVRAKPGSQKYVAPIRLCQIYRGLKLGKLAPAELQDCESNPLGALRRRRLAERKIVSTVALKEVSNSLGYSAKGTSRDVLWSR